MTDKEYKKLKRISQLKMKCEIENILHPTPWIGNVNILHEHLRENIRFSAWDGDNKINNRELIYAKTIILMTDNFYASVNKDLVWLAGKEEI